MLQSALTMYGGYLVPSALAVYGIRISLCPPKKRKRVGAAISLIVAISGIIASGLAQHMDERANRAYQDQTLAQLHRIADEQDPTKRKDQAKAFELKIVSQENKGLIIGQNNGSVTQDDDKR